jgi:hypothetical protein
VGGAIKQKGIEASNIENEMEDCKECTATLSFYVISGSDLSQVHMVVENLRVTGDIPDEGGCDCSTTSGDTSDRRCEGHNMSLNSDRRMMTSGDTSDRRCEGHNMSPNSDRRMMTSGDTSDRRYEGYEMSPSTDRCMATSGDTSGEGV